MENRLEGVRVDVLSCLWASAVVHERDTGLRVVVVVEMEGSR